MSRTQLEPQTEPRDTTAARRLVRPPLWRCFLRRYPHVQQHDETDCGAACLAMVTAWYGNPVGPARLRDLANVDADGATMWSVARAAEALGFHARGLELGFEALQDIHLPAILHWQGFHYVVIYEIGRNHVVIDDPGVGRQRLTKEEFLAGWTRRALELVPSEELTRIEPRRSAWQRFLPVAWPYKAMILEVLIASLLLSFLGLGIPVFTQVVVDRVLVHRSAGLLNMLLAGMLVVGVLQAAIRGVRQLVLVHVSTRFDARLVGDFFRHVFRLPMRFFDLRRVGDIVSRVSENEKIRDALTSTLPAVLLDTVLAAGYFALLAWYSLELTAVVLAVIPFFATLMWVFTPLIRRSEKLEFSKYAEAATYVIESVNGMGTVKAMAVEPQVRWKMESLFLDSLLAYRKGAHISTAYSGLATLVQTTSSVLFLWYGAHQVLEGGLTVGQLLAFVTIAGNVITPILSLVSAWDRLQDARNAADRLNDVFEAECEQKAERALVCPKRLEGRIHLERVKFSYTGQDDELTLNGIDLEVLPGETVAVVGRSGSGKTTLMKLLLGLYPPTKGRIFIDGSDLRALSLPALRRRLGVVPQDVFLFSGTIRENIALGDPDVSFQRVVEAAKLAGAHDFISRMGMGYDTKVGERGMSLSGGQRQRIALARALLGDPDILLLDEATSNLDTVSERAIQRSLEGACENRTTLIIAHRLSTIRHADRILVMDEGRIVEEGSHAELLRRGGLYTTLIGQQLNQ